MKHWIDALFILVTIVSFFRGYRAGFTTTIFSFVGFIGGGLLGLVIGLRYFESHGVTKFLLLFLAVTIGSSIGEAILNRIGKLFHSKFLFGPFKSWSGFLDSACRHWTTDIRSFALNNSMGMGAKKHSTKRDLYHSQRSCTGDYF
jgi:hypothetical protein